MSMSKPILYSYFRSSCSWRVRLALTLKGIDYEYRPVHLIRDGGEQHKEEYRRINPLGQLPAFVVDGVTITQSVAILEFLEEEFPEKPLLPHDAFVRAKVREIVEMINSGIQPIQNLSVMQRFSDDPAKRTEWSAYWIKTGLTAVEKILEKSAGRCCVGDSPTLADCCLVPQIYNAKRFNVDMSEFPVVCRVDTHLANLDAFKAAHPDNQPDCPP